MMTEATQEGRPTVPLLRLFYGAVADGSMPALDPDSVYGMIDDMASDPAAVSNALRLSVDADTETLRDGLADIYREAAAEGDNTLVEALERERDGRFDRFAASVSRSQGIPESDIEDACVSLQDGYGAAFDRMVANYYDS